MKHLEEIIAQLSEFVKERVKDCAPKSLRKERKPYKKTGPSVFLLDRTPGLKKFFKKVSKSTILFFSKVPLKANIFYHLFRLEKRSCLYSFILKEQLVPFPHRLRQPSRLSRPVALRPILSNGLPFRPFCVSLYKII